MRYLPVFLEVATRRCLVVGGGAVAARKADWLLRAGARVCVVAPALDPALAQAAAAGTIEHLSRRFDAADLAGAWLVIAATDEPATNAAVAAAAACQGVPVNVVDAPAASSFIVPAVIERDPVTVAVSTEGQSPVLATRLRALIETLLPANYGALARFMGERRAMVKAARPDLRARRLLWQALLEGPAADAILAGAEDRADAILAGLLAGAPAAPPPVTIVVLASEDPDALTLGALRALLSADRVVAAAGVGARVRTLARRDATQLELGAAPSPEARLAALAPAGAEAVVYLTRENGTALAPLVARLGSRARILQGAPRDGR